MRKIGLFGLLERAGRLMRALGLGRVVDGVRRLLERGLRRNLTSPIEVDGLLIAGSSIGHAAHIRAWRDGQEERLMAQLFKDAIEGGTVVVDVGAYVGYFTLLAAREVGSEGRVLAFEPNPESRALLERNIDLNGYGDRVTVIGKALSSSSGSAAFYWDDRDGSRSGLAVPDDCGGETTVELTTLDAELGDSAAGVVKIDIEGGEVGALKGMARLLGESKRGLTLFVECNDEALQSSGTNPAELLELLAGAGLDVSVIDEAEGRLAPAGAPATVDPLVNLYCVREGARAQEGRPANSRS